MTDKQEITAEKGELVTAHIYRRAARTIERLEREVTALHAGMREQEPHAELGRLIERIRELSQPVPVLMCVDAADNTHAPGLDAFALRQLVAALEAARKPEAVPAPSGAVYEVRDGELWVHVTAARADYWTQAHATPTCDLDHVHALIHGRKE